MCETCQKPRRHTDEHNSPALELEACRALVHPMPMISSKQSATEKGEGACAGTTKFNTREPNLLRELTAGSARLGSLGTAAHRQHPSLLNSIHSFIGDSSEL